MLRNIETMSDLALADLMRQLALDLSMGLITSREFKYGGEQICAEIAHRQCADAVFPTFTSDAGQY